MHPAPTDHEVATSAEWLSEAFQGAYPGTVISRVTPVGEFTTLATKVTLELEYENAPPGAPTSVFMKGFFGELGEARAWIGEPEARFFSELAPMLDLRMPRAVYAGVDPRNHHGIVILHDLVAEGAHFLTALSPYSPDQVDATLGELAKLHAQSWDSPVLENAWLQPVVEKFTGYRSTEDLQDLLDGERGTPLPDDICNAARLKDAVAAAFAATADERRSLVHGDAHAGNLYLDAHGDPGICDWQIVSRGHWSFDVAYHLAAALEMPERRRSEEALVHAYVEHMRDLDVDMPAWDDAWLAYRRALVYGYNLWAVTTTVDPRITHEFVFRLGTTVADHASMELLGV